MSVSDDWKKLNETTVWAGPYWEHRKMTYKLPDGSERTYEYPWHRDGVQMLVVNDASEVLIQSQFRPFVGHVMDQLPAGGLDVGESPLEGAKRELKEEAGITGADWQELGWFYPSSGSYNRKGFAFLVREITRTDASGGDEFELSHRWVPIREVDQMMLSGRMPDAWAMCTWMLARPFLIKDIDG